VRPAEILLPPGEAARIRRAADFLRKRLPRPPEVGVVLGSGQGAVDLGPPDVEIPFVRIPEFLRPRVKGHAGILQACGPALVLRGRVHLYEGHSPEEVVRPVRVLAALGAGTLVLANASGACSPRLKPGDLMMLSDHLNLSGVNPLAGAANFLGLAGLYDEQLRARVKERFRVKEGVYAAVPGPTYETPAEARMLRALGADAVGMSTVAEAIAARAAGMRVAALSLVTNRAGEASLGHPDVLRLAETSAERLRALILALCEEACRKSGPGGRPR
jgi:purine-nucleoside phosphorylase